MTMWGTEFQTVQPVCTGIARSVDEWGLQRRIRQPADTAMELKLIKAQGSGHVLGVRDVASVLMLRACGKGVITLLY